MTATVAKRSRALKGEAVASSHLPYSAHVTPTVIETDQREYLTVLRVTGASFESADDEQLNNWHKRLNALQRSIASMNVGLWQHVCRRYESTYPEGEFTPGFARDLDRDYAERLQGENLMVNELYLSIVHQPRGSGLQKGLKGLFSSKNAEDIAREREEAVDTLNKVVREVMATLTRYEAEPLSVYEYKGVMFSEAVEFLTFLQSGEWNRCALAIAPIKNVISVARPLFGNETVEIRGATSSTYGAMLGINSYSPDTHTGFLNHLLVAPYQFVLTQSFTFMSMQRSAYKLKNAERRMILAGDDAVSQVEELADARDDLAARRLVMGEHHFSLMVKSNDPSKLNDNVADAKTALSEAGITAVREDLALVAAFWAQFPGNFKSRPRVSPVTSKNFAGFCPLHNFPQGRRQGNHWGEALTMFVTSASTPYYFSFHAADPNDADGGTKKDVGHTMILGPTGSGKTALVSFLLCMLQKSGVTSVLFTKDRDTEIVIRALGGSYYPIEPGTPTGWNPFWLDETPTTLAFLCRFVKKLCNHSGHALSVIEEKQIDEAVTSVMRLEKQYRRLGRVLDYLTKSRDGAYALLSRWCYARKEGDRNGPNAWLFDNEKDTLLSDFGSSMTTGFDVTAFLDDAELRAPINMYLFHLTNQLIDGRRFALFIAEFWKTLGDPEMAAFARDQLKTMRKKNGFVVMDSQSPSDALTHEISRTLIEQTPTKILFPNPDAVADEYMDGGLNCSEREYRLVKEDIAEGSRMFLVKQGHHSVVAKLDLKGFDFALNVLSSRSQNIEIMNEIINCYGSEPANWLGKFKEKVCGSV